MIVALMATVVIVFAASVWLTSQVRRLAIAHGILDTPNARSSHQHVTPRGGGLAIVAATAAGLVAGWWLGFVDGGLALALLAGGIPVAAVGFMDDRRPLGVRARLVVHLAAASASTYVLGGFPALQVGSSVHDPGLLGDLLCVVALLWCINLFNFMDGIDGIAATEAIFVCALGGALGWVTGATSLAGAAFIVAAAVAGFLVWNWPPAKIFLGDVGSGFLGLCIGVLGLAAGKGSGVGPFVWLILGSAFFADSTLTLLRRWARRSRVHEAHREHGYQWLSRRWKSHRRVVIAVATVNFLWLGPLATWAALNEELAAWLVLAALAPVAVAAWVAGAGRRESP